MVIWSWTSNVANCGQNVPVGSTPTDTIGLRSCSRLSARYVLVVLKWRKNRSIFKARRVFSFDIVQCDSFLRQPADEQNREAFACESDRIQLATIIVDVPVAVENLPVVWMANEKRSAWTCWVSGVKFNHGSTSSRWRSCDCTTHDREDLRDRSRSSWNMKHFRHSHRARLLDCTSRSTASTGMRHACSRRRIVLVSGHDRSHAQCTTTKDRSRKKAVMAALWSFLLDRLDVERSILRFPSLLHALEGALRILAKGNWKIESFLWGGRFGRSLLCPGRAEKETRGSWPTTGCLPVDRNQLGPDSWRDEKGVWDRTHTHTDTDTHTHTHTHTQLKRRGPPGPRR